MPNDLHNASSIRKARKPIFLGQKSQNKIAKDASKCIKMPSNASEMPLDYQNGQKT